MLELHSAYNLMYLRNGGELKMAFSNTSGHFDYCVMPYGLSCTHSVFQCLIIDVLREMLGKYFLAYTDNIAYILLPMEAMFLTSSKFCLISWNISTM